MLKIRLQRAGRRNLPFYRIVVAEDRSPIKGRYLELLGHCNPLSRPKLLEVKKEKVEHWVSLGAHPSQTVARLLLKQGISVVEKFIEKRVMKPTRAERAAQEKIEKKESEAPKEESAPKESSSEGSSNEKVEKAETVPEVSTEKKAE
ncbi:30S ribosomal protein S16 [Candidatus Peregrinibacteria bacterium]|nr:30S ribosomal protein S16 [Candidatus Peregrinibacteria bacterium]